MSFEFNWLVLLLSVILDISVEDELKVTITSGMGVACSVCGCCSDC